MVQGRDRGGGGVQLTVEVGAFAGPLGQFRAQFGDLVVFAPRPW
ncbi:hypothetical protein [Kutzneria albida]|nr:hypothetical protein [Kutzneria albida]